jgi:hypothetical protein
MKIGPLIPVPHKRKGPCLTGWQRMSPEELEKHLVNWNENFAVRLDNYASIDPDTPEAQIIVNEWDAEGMLPTTVSWRTARGIVRRLYRAIPGTERLQIPGIKLDLRHGAGFCDIIPPSYVIDKDKNISGHYKWVEGHDPESIEVAPLPQHILDYFKLHCSSFNNAFHKERISKDHASNISLTQPGRDEELFHIALTLFKGGMGYADVEYLVRVLGDQCSPPFSEKDSLRKVESAFKRYGEGRGGNVAAEVKEWVIVTPGEFNVTSCYQDLGCVNVRDKASVRKALQRLTEEGIIIPVEGKKGLYRPVLKDMNRIKLGDKSNMGEEIDLKYPFQLEEWYRTLPKTVIIVAGEPDAGKTAWLLNFVYKNLSSSSLPLHYFTSEMGPLEFFDRASNFSGFVAEEWDRRVNIWERSDNFQDVIFPDAINLIDFMEIHEDFWQVGGNIYRIWNKLRKGIAIIALHKDPLKPNPKGGMAAKEKARLVMTLNAGNREKPNIMTIDKIKNWRNRLVNIKGKQFSFKIINGCTLKNIEDVTEGISLSRKSQPERKEEWWDK